nr:senescence-specific cysteine protease SAG39-like [Ipomoea batatas]
MALSFDLRLGVVAALFLFGALASQAAGEEASNKAKSSLKIIEENVKFSDYNMRPERPIKPPRSYRSGNHNSGVETETETPARIGAPNPKPSSREESGHPRENRSAKSAEQSEARLLVVVTALLVLGAWASQATARPLEEPSMFEEWMLRHARSNNNNNHVNKAKKDNSELKFIKSFNKVARKQQYRTDAETSEDESQSVQKHWDRMRQRSEAFESESSKRNQYYHTTFETPPLPRLTPSSKLNLIFKTYKPLLMANPPPPLPPAATRAPPPLVL